MVVPNAVFGSSGPRVADPQEQMNIAARDEALTEGCERLRGHFVPIPEPSAPGATPTVDTGLGGGRWIIVECSARPGAGSQISLHLSGPLWHWVDRREGGFGWAAHVEQYIYANVSLDLEGQFEAAYDTQAHVMSVWLRPLANGARVEPIRGVQLHVETFGAADILPGYAQRSAWTEVETEGQKQLTQVFANGMTITRTAYGQLDFAVGHLPLGVVPTRPFLGTEQYLVNLRQALHPGGIVVDGPFPASTPIALDAEVVQGSAVGYHAYCQDYVLDDYTRFFQGRGFTLLVNRDGTTWIGAGHQVHTTISPPTGCVGKWVIATGVPFVPPSPHLPPYTPPTLMKVGVRVAQR
jgi:hypothetical protein